VMRWVKWFLPLIKRSIKVIISNPFPFSLSIKL
jgi:hypothetical protein